MRINQGDPRWANLPYRSLPYTVVEEGCGLCAVSMCANLTPLDTIDFMRQFATNGDGTTGEGIGRGLDEFVGNHTAINVSSSMTPLWNELEKGNRVGVILFGKQTAPDGTVWTMSGHYVEFDDYKVEGGLHWLYTQDSSYRNHTGWYCYERSMRGCIPSTVWVARRMKNGWIKEDGKWYFYKADKMVKNNWVQDKEGKWYFLGDNGAMVTSNMKEWKGDKYYLKANGEMASNEWIKFQNGWRYFIKNGKMKKGWLRWKNNLYYLDSKGYMVTGGRNVPCTFDKDGKMVIK